MVAFPVGNAFASNTVTLGQSADTNVSINMQSYNSHKRYIYDVIITGKTWHLIHRFSFALRVYVGVHGHESNWYQLS